MMTEYVKGIDTPENWKISQSCHPVAPVKVSILTLCPSHTTLYLLWEEVHPGLLPVIETQLVTPQDCGVTQRLVLPILKYLSLILISLHSLLITPSRLS